MLSEAEGWARAETFVSRLPSTSLKDELFSISGESPTC